MSFLDFAREQDMAGVALRLTLSVLLGGLIGLEREFKRRPAGFRTHILICLGSAVTALTGQYLSGSAGLPSDMGRLSAQVIAGMGFIGAGAIIVTRRQRVKGLTTAAGLWTSAVLGLACGFGYVEGAVLGAAFVLLTELLLTKLEHRFAMKEDEVHLFIEYSDSSAIDDIARILRENGLEMGQLERSKDGDRSSCAVLTMRLSRRKLDGEVLKSITGLESVLAVEEL